MIPEYRAAISLNNTGVTLVQRRCFRQGMYTLNDAVALMNIAVLRTRHLESGGEEPLLRAPPLCIETMLRNAAQRLSRLEPTEFRQGHRDIEVLSDNQCPAEILPEELTTEADEQQQQRCPPSPSSPPAVASPASAVTSSRSKSCALFLRIEVMESDASPKDHDFELQSSIILQNFGSSYMCMVDLTDDLCARQELLIGAMRIFHSSYSILSYTCEALLDSDVDSTQLQRVVLATTLVLQNLVQLSVQLGLLQDLREYETRLDHLQTFARTMPRDCGQGAFAAGAA